MNDTKSSQSVFWDRRDRPRSGKGGNESCSSGGTKRILSESSEEQLRQYAFIRRHTESQLDVICGGFPCQDISTQGKGKGIVKGEQSGLWSEMFKAIRMVRPRYIIVENVPAFTFRGLDKVLGDLAGIGYDAEWFPLRASEFGAIHERKRIFIIAYPKGKLMEALGQPFGKKKGHTGCGKCNKDSDGFTGYGYWKAEPRVDRLVYGISGRMDRIKGLGNAVVPQVAEFIGRRIMEYEKSK